VGANPKPAAASSARSLSYRSWPGARVVPPYPSRVDLHSHSRRSDGVLEPAELVAQAAAAGVKVLALSDHDTLAGVRELRAPGAAPLPLELVAAVEINSVAAGMGELWEGELHILGLGVDTDDDTFEATLARQRGFRVTRFRHIVDRLRELGYPIDEQVERYLAESGAVPGAALGRPQIARCLVAAGHATSVDDAMQRLLALGKPAYVARDGLGPVAAIEAIRAAGGVASLAHFADAPKRRDLVEELKERGLDALEVHYRHFPAETIVALERLADEMRLLRTGGSDYHGDGETYAEAHATLFVPDTDASALFGAPGRPFPAVQA
jgi:3',5'-nucleoside bisphosphate phosphatase